MKSIPQEKTFDSTLGLALDGYEFVDKRCRQHDSDVFEARLMLQPTIFLRGQEAARLFYDVSRFQRRDAAPHRLIESLFGRGGVQMLDGDAHRRRKEMFMALMGRESIDALAAAVAGQWQARLPAWETAPQVVLAPEVERILARAVCAWAGVPLPDEDVDKRTRDLVALFDGAGGAGPRHWRSRAARKRCDQWIAGVVEGARTHKLAPPAGSALHTVAWHRGQDGKLLANHVAAVELINVLRPTVAVSRYIVFAALALHEHPHTRAALLNEGDAYTEWFVQELRRYYPFFPNTVARTAREFEWNGYRFPAGVRTILDIYATNHDARLWEQPYEFRPERFRDRSPGQFDLIAQGGGEHLSGHRCPGEWITIALVKVALEFLTRRMRYEVPPQDLGIRLNRIPAVPKSRFVISRVERIVSS